MYTYEVKNKQGVLKIKIPAQEFEEAINHAYERTKSKYKVQGFRNGKAPRRVIEQTYGDTVFFDEAFEEAVQNEYSKFLDENVAVKPADYPHVEDNKYTREKGLEVTLVFDLIPEVQLGAVSGLKSKLKQVKIDSTKINHEIENLRSTHARFVESDKPAEDGDFATIDFSGTVDGVKFDGGTANDYRLELGSHTFIEGFEEQIVGMKVGEKRDVKVTFPKNYHVDSLKGKPAVFETTLKKVEKKQLPEVNDKFISDVTEFETLDEYKKDVKAKLTAQEEKQAELDYESALIEEISQNSKVEIPHSMVHNEAHEMIHDFEHRLSHQGMKLEDYLSYIGKTYQQFHDEREIDAEKNIKTRLVLQKLISQYKISVTNQDVENKIADYAKQYDLNVEEVKKGLSQQDYLYFNNQALMEKVIAFIKEQNK